MQWGENVGSEARRSGKTAKQEKRNKGKEIMTKSKKKRKKFGKERIETEYGRGNEWEQYACRKHLRLIIDHLSIRSLCSQPTLRDHYMRRVVFSTVKNSPCCGWTVRCFFLDGKCRRHKCLFDLMTRCPIWARAATHTREHLSPSLRPFRVSVGGGASNSPKEKEKEGKRKKKLYERNASEVAQQMRH